MHEAAFTRAALPAPVVCLGMVLRPYSLGHELLLLREGNPLALHSSPPRHEPSASPDAPAALSSARSFLEGAVVVCSQTFEESRAMQIDVFLSLKMLLWRHRVRKQNTPLELARFREYQLFGNLEFPRAEVFRPGRTEPRLPGAPFLLRLHQFLVTRMNHTEASALDYPLGLAKMQWQAYWENEGGLDIYNEQDAEFDDYVAMEEAKAAKEKLCPA